MGWDEFEDGIGVVVGLVLLVLLSVCGVTLNE